MRTIEWTNQFKRDYKRESRGRHRSSIESELGIILELLANDLPLEPRHHDHDLTGEWKDFRDCHIKPDLVMIYLRVEPDSIRLVRLGSHSELGL